MDNKYKPVQYIIDNKIIEGLIRDYSVDYQFRDDLTQEIYMILLDSDQAKLQDIINKKQIRFYVARILRNQFYSSTSPFYKQYKKPLLLKETLKPILDMENGNDDETNENN